jgi:hypothetical protein
MNHSITSGRWEIIGNSPLDKDLQETPYFFKQDSIDKNKISLYKKGEEIPALPEECVNLERAAVWEPGHVEDRLRDYFLNKPNKWVESLKIKR